MGRYIFTEADLEPFRIFLEHPLAEQVLSAAVPIKQLTTPALHVEEAPAPLAVDIQTKETPQGVPLHDVLSAVQKEVPGVQALQMRGDTVLLTHTTPPSQEDREKIGRVLSNPMLFAGPRAAPTAAAGASELAKTLTDDATSDQDWLRAFRQYAVKFLIKENP